MGFRDPIIRKLQPNTINYISIDRTHRDLSNEICFTIGTQWRMNPYMKY